ECRGRNNCGLNPRVMNPDFWRHVASDLGINAGLPQGLTKIVLGMRPAIGGHLGEVRNSTCGDLDREAAVRKSKRASTARVQPVMLWPFVQHISKQRAKLSRPAPQF